MIYEEKKRCIFFIKAFEEVNNMVSLVIIFVFGKKIIIIFDREGTIKNRLNIF